MLLCMHKWVSNHCSGFSCRIWLDFAWPCTNLPCERPQRVLDVSLRLSPRNCPYITSPLQSQHAWPPLPLLSHHNCHNIVCHCDKRTHFSSLCGHAQMQLCWMTKQSSCVSTLRIHLDISTALCSILVLRQLCIFDAHYSADPNPQWPSPAQPCKVILAPTACGP